MEAASAQEQTAQTQQRAAEGQISKESPPSPSSLPHPNKPQKKSATILSRFFTNSTKVRKTADDTTLVDVHIGNPLRKITQILEEIKKQKAFTFDIKGSLGLAGIVLVVTSFGIFGGTKALYNKGEQSQIGLVRVLGIAEETKEPTLFNRAVTAWNTLLGKPTEPSASPHNRIVLVKQDQAVLRLTGTLPKDFSPLQTGQVMVTGELDGSSQTLTVKEEKGIEQYSSFD